MPPALQADNGYSLRSSPAAGDDPFPGPTPSSRATFKGRLAMPRSQWRGPRVAVLALTLALVGCISVTEQSQQVRAAILGSNERSLLGCLGPPDDFRYAEDRHHFLYRFDLRRSLSVDPTDLSQPAFCNLLFQIDQGRISDLQVRGIDGYGLNADTRCTVIAGQCLSETRSSSAAAARRCRHSSGSLS